MPALLLLALAATACGTQPTARERCLAELEAFARRTAAEPGGHGTGTDTAGEAFARRTATEPDGRGAGTETAGADAAPQRRRLAELRQRPGSVLRRQELAWWLVPALGLEYRLRRGREPAHCHELLASMGAMPGAPGDAPVGLDELRRIVNRAALPEGELVLPGPAPLPAWLWRPP